MAIGLFTKRMKLLTSVLLLLSAGAVSAGPSRSAVMEELSSRSRIPVSELRILLSDCGRTQQSMNICAFRDFVESDLELDGAIEAKRRSLPKACRMELGRAQMVWEAERDRECQEETLDAEGGSMRPMLISACKARANKARIASVKRLRTCPLK